MIETRHNKIDGNLFGIIILMQVLFFLLMLKSFTFGYLFLFLSIIIPTLFIWPEFGLIFAMTGNILTYAIFDYLQLTVPAPPVVILHLFLMIMVIAVIYLKDPTTQIPFEKVGKLVIGILFLLIIGVLYSTNRSYGITKVVFYIIYNFIIYFVALFLIDDQAKIGRLLTFTYLTGIVLASYCILQPRAYYFDYVRYTVSSSVNPIFLSRSLGISILAGLYWAFQSKHVIKKIVYIASLPILLQPMIWSGSRGPLLAVLMCFLAFYLLEPRRGVFIKISVSLAGAAVGVLFLIKFASQVTSRLITPIAEETSAAFRFIAWIQSVKDFASSPLLGIGTGSFYLKTFHVPLIYPHNLILELMGENGIFGLIFILLFLFYSFNYGWQALKLSEGKQRKLVITLITMFIFAFLNSCLSGEIFRNEMLWITSGLLTANYFTVTKK